MLRWLFLLVILQVGVLQAQTVQQLEVEGNERLPDESVLQYISTRKGEQIQKTKIRDDLKSLYNTGLFKDVKIEAEEVSGGLKLIVKVEEKPYVQDFEIKGASAASEDDLKKALELKPPFLWDELLLKSSLEKLRKHYRTKGFNLVSISTDFRMDGRKRILVFDIDEGSRVTVKKIVFQGNSVLSDEQLKESMITKEGGHWSTLSNSGRFDKDLLTQVDARRIQMEYMKRGYAFAQVESPSISFTPDRKGVFISYYISEGDRYNVGEITFSGDLDFIPDAEKQKQSLASQKGETWNYFNIQKDIQALQDLYGDQGYAYTNVSPNWKISSEDASLLDIEMRVDKGGIVYFGNIDVTGNLETLDRVIRRELEINEGELFNLTRFRASKENLEKLGYFTTVNFVQKDVLADQRMDIVIEVEEKQTGSLTLGASFSSFDSFGFQGAVSKVNLLGRGYDISLSALFSGKRQLFSLMFRNPRVYDTKVAMTLNGFNTEYQSSDETKIVERGGSVALSYPLNKEWRVGTTYGLRDVGINIQEIVQNLYPDSFGLSSSLGFSLTRDTLNTREIFLPSKGSSNSVSTTMASKYLGSDMSYWQSSYQGKKYLEVFDEESLIFPASVLSFGLRLDYIQGTEGRSIPFNERYFPGGIYSIRGHQYRSLGPYTYVPINITGRRADDGELDVTDSNKLRLGGNKQVIANIEYLFDLFKEAKIKGVLFFDSGNTFPEESLSLSDIRYSTGFGFRWFSPLGPLRFEWGIPLDKKPGEDSILFDFSIGAPF